MKTLFIGGVKAEIPLGGSYIWSMLARKTLLLAQPNFSMMKCKLEFAFITTRKDSL